MFNPVSCTAMAPLQLGIFGAGQLGRMLAQAALPLGIRCVFLDAVNQSPAAALGPVFSPDDMHAFVGQRRLFTLEFENIPLSSIDALPEAATIFPPRAALAITQNRLLEKSTFDALNIPVAPYRAVHCLTDLQNAADQLGLPMVLKTATGGYDGKGQYVVKTAHDIARAWETLGTHGPLIAEGFIHFEREVSVIAVRAQTGDIRYWELAQNHHHQGILSHSVVPAPNIETLTPIAQQYMQQLLEHLNYVGVLTLELFVTPEGLLANEMAPRVHNSGHWTIEGAVCSQFENHIRAVMGLPLGETDLIKPCVMVNIIGQYPKREDILALPAAHLHDYEKEERPGRKLGHITLMPPKSEELPALIKQLIPLLPDALALK